MKKSLKRTDRGLSHYRDLKKDLESSNERISKSLPLFIRIMYYDTNPWIKQINRFDFLRLATLDKNFGIIDTKINKWVSYCSKISPKKADHLEISLENFFESRILKIQNKLFTVKDFVFALAYNGGIHMVPDKKFEETYNLIYEELFEKYPIIAFNLTEQISQVFVQIFDELYSILIGENNAYAFNTKFAPKIVENGKMLEGNLFEHAYLQFPIREKKSKGIRFCLEIKIRNNSSKNKIFEYGHRQNESLQIKLFQSNNFTVLDVKTTNDKCTLRYDLKDKVNEFISLEIALYPSGHLILAINNLVVANGKINDKISIIDGKVIIGSDLSGNSFGDFFEKTITAQSIDRNNDFRVLNAYAMKRLKLPPQNILYNQIKREFIN
ncbi:hypothetical protein LB465_11080 [Salegentibacter sp. LM13S]|uniref:hypothetical protein n=1 Tax=Salegentibacter lacus TaxID=2873599 RepID=UPI001CCDAB2F|nr:hypothetical protein [Salegentibacter lacus]MBZ9631322.1 hypothetical protein [Salegentibacter lacus]